MARRRQDAPVADRVNGVVVHACPLLVPGASAFRPGPPDDRARITVPHDAVEVVRPLLAGHDRERAVLVALDTRHRVIATTLVSIGTAANTFLAPREVFRDALGLGASAIVVAHNHPSGDARPSDDDRQITRRLAQAGATIGIDLLDHLVIGDPEWTSLARLGVCGG